MRGSRPIALPSAAYEKFKKEVGQQMLKYKRERFTGKLYIDYFFFIKGKMRQDADNAMASINDLLQEFGIIEDDNNIEGGTFGKIHDCKEWKTEVIIYYE